MDKRKKNIIILTAAIVSIATIAVTVLYALATR